VPFRRQYREQLHQPEQLRRSSHIRPQLPNTLRLSGCVTSLASIVVKTGAGPVQRSTRLARRRGAPAQLAVPAVGEGVVPAARSLSQARCCQSPAGGTVVCSEHLGWCVELGQARLRWAREWGRRRPGRGPGCAWTAPAGGWSPQYSADQNSPTPVTKFPPRCVHAPGASQFSQTAFIFCGSFSTACRRSRAPSRSRRRWTPKPLLSVLGNVRFIALASSASVPTPRATRVHVERNQKRRPTLPRTPPGSAGAAPS